MPLGLLRAAATRPQPPTRSKDWISKLPPHLHTSSPLTPHPFSASPTCQCWAMETGPREPRVHINERKAIFCAAQHLNSCRHTSDRILAATLDFLYPSLATLQHITTHPGTGHRDQAPGGRPTAPHLSFPTPTLLSHPNAPVGSADFKSAPAPSLTHTMVII